MKYFLSKSDGPRALADVLRIARKPGDMIGAKDLDLELPGPWAYPEFRYRMLAPWVDLSLEKCRVTMPPDFVVRRTLNTDTGELVDRPDRDLPMLWCGYSSRVFAEGTTFHAKWEDFPGWCPSGIRFVDGGDWAAHGGTMIGGSGMYAEQAKEQGIHLLSNGSEAFMLSSGGTPGAIAVSDWKFIDPKPGSYTSMLMIGGDAPLASTYRNRETGSEAFMLSKDELLTPKQFPSVKNISTEGDDYWFSFSANVQPRNWNEGPAVTFTSCSSKGARHAFYNDTGHTSARLDWLTIQDNRYAAIRMVGGAQEHVRNISLHAPSITAECFVNLEGPSKSTISATGHKNDVEAGSIIKCRRLAVIANSGHRVIVRKDRIVPWTDDAAFPTFHANTADAQPPIII